MITKMSESHVTHDQIERDLDIENVLISGAGGQLAEILVDRLDAAALLYTKALDLYGQDAVWIYPELPLYVIHIRLAFATPPIVRDIAHAVGVSPDQVIPDGKDYAICYGASLALICEAYHAAMSFFDTNCVNVEKRIHDKHITWFYLIIKPYAANSIDG